MVTSHGGVVGRALVGRELELGLLSALFNRAIAGAMGMLLVSGDAGVGKTALVHHARTRVPSETHVLVGACLPLTSLTVPFLPLRAAIRDCAPEPPPPTLTASGDRDPSDVPVFFDDWLGQLCQDRLVVLVIDDLQWADQSTLDVLTYVIAGPAERRLAIIGTYRSGGSGDDHQLQRWLADIRRMPHVEQMILKPLDRQATSAQLEDLLGSSPHQSLVEEVFAHTLGNSYLNRLVIAELPAGARQLSATYPPDLTAAVLQSWRLLTPSVRELLRILAVGGRPLHPSELQTVLANETSSDTGPMLREAAEAGTLDVLPDGTYWFHHPLIAEALEKTLDGEERRRWHSDFARWYEMRESTDVETLAAIADHHDRADHHEEAYRWALRASGAAGAAGGVSEMLRLLRRAVTLRAEVPTAEETEQQLLQRWLNAAAAAGAQEEELHAVERLLAIVQRDAQPLLVTELLIRRMLLRFSTGQAFLITDDMHAAVRLSAGQADSWEHALALAEQVHAGVWHDEAEAVAQVDRAVALARSAGHPRALTFALTAKAMVEVNSGRPDEARRLANESRQAAIMAGDCWGMVHAIMWEANAVDRWSTREYSELLRQRREELSALQVPPSLPGSAVGVGSHRLARAGRLEAMPATAADGARLGPRPAGRHRGSAGCGTTGDLAGTAERGGRALRSRGGTG